MSSSGPTGQALLTKGKAQAAASISTRPKPSRSEVSSSPLAWAMRAAMSGSAPQSVTFP